MEEPQPGTSGRSHDCQKCHRGYQNSGDLRKHLITCYGRLPTTCRYCRKQFTDDYIEFNDHYRLHKLENLPKNPLLKHLQSSKGSKCKALTSYTPTSVTSATPATPPILPLQRKLRPLSRKPRPTDSDNLELSQSRDFLIKTYKRRKNTPLKLLLPENQQCLSEPMVIGYIPPEKNLTKPTPPTMYCCQRLFCVAQFQDEASLNSHLLYHQVEDSELINQNTDDATKNEEILEKEIEGKSKNGIEHSDEVEGSSEKMEEGKEEMEEGKEEMEEGKEEMEDEKEKREDVVEIMEEDCGKIEDKEP